MPTVSTCRGLGHTHQRGICDHGAGDDHLGRPARRRSRTAGTRCGPECCFGALTSGDVELLEYSYPIIIHRYSLMTDSGGAGKFRGGSGTAWEVEPLDKRDDLCIGFGEGRRIPAVGAAGAVFKDDRRQGRPYRGQAGRRVETIRNQT
jgi:hypothetical protein